MAPSEWNLWQQVLARVRGETSDVAIPPWLADARPGALDGSHLAVTLPGAAGGIGAVPPPSGSESYITNAPVTHNATTTSKTMVDRRVGSVNIIIQGGDPRNIRRELEKFFEDLAAQSEGIEGVEIV